MEKGVLFDGAASDVEILEFKVGKNSYGVVLNDIKEILKYNNGKNSIPVPNSHPYLEGMIKPRDFIIPIINLFMSLKLTEQENNKNEMLIVSNINDLNIGFHVDSVTGIKKIMKSKISKPGKKLSTVQKDFIIGVYSYEDNKVEIIEFGKIIHSINPELNADKTGKIQ